MGYIWSYLIMALCTGVTSARVMDFPGNRNGFQDNLVRGLKDEKVLAPPTGSDLIIDSTGFPGNSNDPKEENVFSEVLSALLNQNYDSEKYQIIPFRKEDFISLENSDICKMMCQDGVEKAPCKCKKSQNSPSF